VHELHKPQQGISEAMYFYFIFLRFVWTISLGKG